jgi:hypothetical protein
MNKQNDLPPTDGSATVIIDEPAGRQVITMPVPMQADPLNALVNVLERAMRDPSIDLDRMQQIMVMWERVNNRIAEQRFDEAMARAQQKIKAAFADSTNTQANSRYASHNAIDKVTRPHYTEQGIMLTFNTEEGAPPDCVRVTARASYAGHSRIYRIDMPADGKGPKGGDVMTKTHATGSAIRYGIRYLLTMIWNVAVSDETDDDGNAAGQRQPGDSISADQLGAIQTLIVRGDFNVANVCDFVSKRVNKEIKTLEEIPAKIFSYLIKALEDAIAKQEQAAEKANKNAPKK